MRVGRREAHSPVSPGLKGRSMWTVVYVAAGWGEAERLKDHLANDGLLVLLRACGSDDDRLAKHVELLVPEIEVPEAHTILMQLVGTVRA